MFRNLILAAAAATPAAATDFPAADLQAMRDATATMLARAAAHYGRVGHDAAIADFNAVEDTVWIEQPFHIHMFAMRHDGIVTADNVWPEFIGTDFTLTADFEGYQFGVDILERTSEVGTVAPIELVFMNPDTGDLSPSIGHCMRPNADTVLCSWANG